MRQFGSSYDTLAKVITAIAIATLAAIPFITRTWWTGLLCLLVALSAFGYSPRGYFVGERMIRIRRFIHDAEIPLQSVREVRKVTPDDLKWTVRLFGSSGFFGFYGLFQMSRLGRCTWYATRIKPSAVVITAAKTALFTPDDVNGFLEAVREQVTGKTAAK